MTLLNLHDDPEAAADFALADLEQDSEAASGLTARPRPRTTGSAKQPHDSAKEARRGHH